MKLGNKCQSSPSTNATNIINIAHLSYEPSTHPSTTTHATQNRWNMMRKMVDPNSSFMSPASSNSFNIRMKGSMIHSSACSGIVIDEPTDYTAAQCNTAVVHNQTTSPWQQVYCQEGIVWTHAMYGLMNLWNNAMQHNSTIQTQYNAMQGNTSNQYSCWWLIHSPCDCLGV